MNIDAIAMKVEEALSDPQGYIDKKIEEAQIHINTIQEITAGGYISFPLFNLSKAEYAIINFLSIAKRNDKNNLFQYLKLGKKFIQLRLNSLDHMEKATEELGISNDQVRELRDQFTMSLMIVEDMIDAIVKERSKHYGEDNMYEDYDDTVTPTSEIGTNPDMVWTDLIRGVLNGIKLKPFSPYDDIK